MSCVVHKLAGNRGPTAIEPQWSFCGTELRVYMGWARVWRRVTCEECLSRHASRLTASPSETRDDG